MIIIANVIHFMCVYNITYSYNFIIFGALTLLLRKGSFSDNINFNYFGYQQNIISLSLYRDIR